MPGNAVFGLTDDHGGLTGTGTDVSVPAGEIVEFAGSIQTTSDVDLFRVVAPENGLLDVGVIADFDLDSELDVVARLYRIDGATRVLIDEDSVGGVIRTRLLQAAVQAGQVFEIEVTGFSGSLGAYTALVGSTPNTVDDFGDTFSSAPTIVIPPNTPTTQQGRVETGMDVDFFRFVPSTSGLLQASVTGTFTKPRGWSCTAPTVASCNWGTRRRACSPRTSSPVTRTSLRLSAPMAWSVPTRSRSMCWPTIPAAILAGRRRSA